MPQTRSPGARRGGGAGKHNAKKDPKNSPPLRAGAISEAFDVEDTKERDTLGLPGTNEEPCKIVVELNLFHAEGLPGARKRFEKLYEGLPTDYEKRPPILIANTYYRCWLSVQDSRRLVSVDQSDSSSRDR